MILVRLGLALSICGVMMNTVALMVGGAYLCAKDAGSDTVRHK